MKKSLLAMALAASMTTAALAIDQQTPEFANNAFTQTDIQTLFGQDGQHAVQLASLSAQEMQETEGAWIYHAAAGAAGGLVGGWSYYNSVPAGNRTWGGWATAVGSGAVGGAIAGIRWIPAPFIGGGIGAIGGSLAK